MTAPFVLISTTGEASSGVSWLAWVMVSGRCTGSSAPDGRCETGVSVGSTTSVGDEASVEGVWEGSESEEGTSNGSGASLVEELLESESVSGVSTTARQLVPMRAPQKARSASSTTSLVGAACTWLTKNKLFNESSIFRSNRKTYARRRRG